MTISGRSRSKHRPSRSPGPVHDHRPGARKPGAESRRFVLASAGDRALECPAANSLRESRAPKPPYPPMTRIRLTRTAPPWPDQEASRSRAGRTADNGCARSTGTTVSLTRRGTIRSSPAARHQPPKAFPDRKDGVAVPKQPVADDEDQGLGIRGVEPEAPIKRLPSPALHGRQPELSHSGHSVSMKRRVAPNKGQHSASNTITGCSSPVIGRAQHRGT